MEVEYTKVGLIGRSFGSEGFCKIKFFDEFAEVATKATFLFINHEECQVPYRVVDFQKARKMIRFSDILDQQKADKLHGSSVFLPSIDVSHLVDTSQHPLMGYLIVTENKTIGKIVDIREMPHQLLATVLYAEKEIFIPIHEDLIQDINEVAGTLEMDLPDGLLEL